MHFKSYFCKEGTVNHQYFYISQQGSLWNLYPTSNTTADQFNLQYSPFANSLFISWLPREDVSYILLTWICLRKLRLWDITDAEYRSFTIHHVRILSYGHKWSSWPQKGQNPGVFGVFFPNEYEVDLLTKAVLGGCRSDILFVCHQQAICQVKHLFNPSTGH